MGAGRLKLIVRGIGYTPDKEPPAAHKKFLNESFDPDYDIDRNEWKILNTLIECQKTEQNQSAAKAEYLRRRVLAPLVSSKIKMFDPYNSSHIEKVVNAYRQGGAWVKDLLKTFGNKYFPLIDLNHLKSPDDRGGWHFCVKKHLEEKLYNQIENPDTKVFQAEFENRKRTKQSTFFPIGFSPDDLVRFLNCESPIFHENNRALYIYEDEKKKFYIEVYRRLNGNIINSAFPVLYFFKYEQGANFKINGQFVNVDIILKTINTHPQFEKAIMYENSKFLVIDIAKISNFSGIKKGVYFQVPKTLITSED